MEPRSERNGISAAQRPRPPAVRYPEARCGEVAQSVEHTAENRGVAGSIPALAILLRLTRGVGICAVVVLCLGVALGEAGHAERTGPTRLIVPRADARRIAAECYGARSYVPGWLPPGFAFSHWS